MGLFGRARQVFQGWSAPEPPAPQYYRVTCPEGHTLRGLRTAGFQALRCQSCAEGVFVLPISPLPEPKAPARRAADRPSPVVAVEDDRPIPLRDAPLGTEAEPGPEEIEWVDAPVPEPEEIEVTPVPEPRSRPAAPAQPEPPAVRPASKPAATARPVADRSGPATRPQAQPRAVGPRLVELPTRRGEGFAAWAFRRRHRLVFAGVAALIVISIAFTVRRRWLEEAPRAIEIARSQGIESLEAGRFDEAYRLLSQGARAADSLGGAHQGAEAVRQAAAEAALIVNLANKPLDEIVEEAARYDPPSRWPARFRDFYRGQSVLVQARVLEPGVPPDQGPVLDLRILTGRGPQPTRTARIDTAGLALLDRVPPAVDADVLFGARLESLALERDGTWAFRLIPESGVPITHRRALVALGWPDDEFATAPEVAGNPQPVERRDDASLKNYTDQEVRSLLGPPEHRARLATQGLVLEQWIYRGLKGRQVINFRRQPGDRRMVVASQFDVP